MRKVLRAVRLMERVWTSSHDNVNFPFSREASSSSSDPLKRELSVWIGITREIWGVPSHKVGGTPELTDIFGDGVIRRRFDCSDLAVRYRH